MAAKKKRGGTSRATKKTKAERSTRAKPKAATRAKPKAATRAKPKAAARAKPKAAARAKPKAAARAKPKVAARAKPKAAARAKPKAAARAKAAPVKAVAKAQTPPMLDDVIEESLVDASAILRVKDTVARSQRDVDEDELKQFPDPSLVVAAQKRNAPPDYDSDDGDGDAAGGQLPELFAAEARRQAEQPAPGKGSLFGSLGSRPDDDDASDDDDSDDDDSDDSDDSD
jgi:hypothetical protein